MEPHREVGRVPEAQVQVEHDRGMVVIRRVDLRFPCIRLTTASGRDDFARIYFQACAEADAWAETAVPP